MQLYYGFPFSVFCFPYLRSRPHAVPYQLAAQQWWLSPHFHAFHCSSGKVAGKNRLWKHMYMWLCMLLMHRNISRLFRNATGEEMVHKKTANDAESSSTTASQCHWCPGLQRTGPTSVTQSNSEHVQQVESTPRYHHLPWKNTRKTQTLFISLPSLKQW